MLFTGEYEHSIDAKHRLAIPAEIRSRLDPETDGHAFYLAPGPNQCLWLWPERTFERMSAKLGESLLPDEDVMDFEEFVFSQASRLEIDSAGRVRLPERMLRWAGLSSTVTILGVRDHLELRDPETWEEIRRAKLSRQSEIMLKARQALREQSSGGGGA